MSVVRIVTLNAWGGAMFDDGERTLPQRANVFEDVSAAFPCHTGVFAASDAGPVLDREGRRRRKP